MKLEVDDTITLKIDEFVFELKVIQVDYVNKTTAEHTVVKIIGESLNATANVLIYEPEPIRVEKVNIFLRLFKIDKKMGGSFSKLFDFVRKT